MSRFERKDRCKMTQSNQQLNSLDWFCGAVSEAYDLVVPVAEVGHEVYTFQTEEVDPLFVPWSQVIASDSSFLFEFLQWERPTGEVVEGWLVYDPDTWNLCLTGLRREGQTEGFRVEYDETGERVAFQTVLHALFHWGVEAILQRAIQAEERLHVRPIVVAPHTIYHALVEDEAGHPLVEWFIADEFPLEPMNRGQWFFHGHSIDSPFS